jgi:uncharacterized protein (TIGR03083 family)
MLDLDAARAAIGREMAAALAELEGIDLACWSKRTRCRDWTVADLVAHLIWGQRLEAQALEGVATGRTEAVEVPPVPVDEPGPMVAALRAAHRQLMDQLEPRTADDLDRGAPMPYGTLPLGILVQVVAMEVGVHHSDLRHALGLTDTLAPDVVLATAAFLGAFLPVLAAGGARPDRPVSYRLAGRDGDVDLAFGWDGQAWSVTEGPVTVTVSGEDSDICLFGLGRTGLARLSVDGDRALAAAFHDYVPGP